MRRPAVRAATVNITTTKARRAITFATMAAITKETANS